MSATVRLLRCRACGHLEAMDTHLCQGVTDGRPYESVEYVEVSAVEERVARALYLTASALLGGKPWTEAPEEIRAEYARAARAAIREESA